MSVGPMNTAPPSSCAFATVASASATAKYTPQFGGISAGMSPLLSIMPPTDRPPSFHSVYAGGPPGGPWSSAPHPKTAL